MLLTLRSLYEQQAGGGTGNITRVGSANNSTSSTVTGFPATLPSGIQANDFILIWVYRSSDEALTGAPSGYTLVRTQIDDAGGTSPARMRLDLYQRLADGSEGTSTSNFTTGTSTRWVILSGVWRGVDTSTPFVVENSTAISTQNVFTSPTVSNTDDNAWAIWSAGFRQIASPVNMDSPVELTELQDVDAGLTGTGNPVAAVADSNGAVVSGSYSYTGAPTTGTSGNAVAWVGFLKPAPGAPSGPDYHPEMFNFIHWSGDGAL